MLSFRLGNSDYSCLCFSLLCYAHLKDTRILRYNTWFVHYDSMCATLEYINWADIMNSMNTLDAWSYFRAILQKAINKFVPLSRLCNKKSTYMSAEACQLRK